MGGTWGESRTVQMERLLEPQCQGTVVAIPPHPTPPHGLALKGGGNGALDLGAGPGGGP